MPELRWALIGLGAVFILGLALWEWRRSRRRLAQSAPELAMPSAGPQGEDDWSRRIEPRIDSLAGTQGMNATADRVAMHDVPVIHPSEPLSVPVARESAIDRPAAATKPLPRVRPAIRWPPERADRVLTLRLVSSQGALLPGREVRLALEQAGLVPGPQSIYHLADPQGAVLVSAANMLRPGDLDPAQMDEQQLRGLSLFSVLPGPMSPVRMLEELVAVGRAISWRLGATVQDEQGTELDGEALVKLRQSLPDGAENGAP
jgi:FtsZ-interacting cell division protein ZipA